MSAITLMTIVFFGVDSWPTLCATLVFVFFLSLAGIHRLWATFNWLISKKPATWLRNLFHLIVVFIAAIPARNAVAQAIGLPPQDFDLSVTLLVGILYIPTWFAVVGIGLLAVAIGQFFYGGALVGVDWLITPKPCLPGFTPRPNDQLSRLISCAASGKRHVELAFGTLLIALFFVGLFGTLTQLIVNQTTLVRWVAYKADYQSIPKYPGISADQRVRIHENGVVSIARPVGWDVEIEVINLDNKDCPEPAKRT